VIWYYIPCLLRLLQNELDEASLARLAEKAAAGGGPKPEAAEGPEVIPGGTDVTSAIAANVWEVLIKVHRAHLCAPWSSLPAHKDCSSASTCAGGAHYFDGCN